jgi:hypothetical protein
VAPVGHVILSRILVSGSPAVPGRQLGPAELGPVDEQHIPRTSAGRTADAFGLPVMIETMPPGGGAATQLLDHRLRSLEVSEHAVAQHGAEALAVHRLIDEMVGQVGPGVSSHHVTLISRRAAGAGR